MPLYSLKAQTLVAIASTEKVTLWKNMHAVDCFDQKIRWLRSGFFYICSYLVLLLFRYWTWGRVVGVVIYRYWVLCEPMYCTLATRNFPPSPPKDAAYWPDTAHTASEGRNLWNLDSNCSFTCPKAGTWDRLFYFPSEGRHVWIFPAASVGSEPAILGTRGQHANH
jgi:hypothetical protein